MAVVARRSQASRMDGSLRRGRKFRPSFEFQTANPVSPARSAHSPNLPHLHSHGRRAVESGVGSQYRRNNFGGIGDGGRREFIERAMQSFEEQFSRLPYSPSQNDDLGIQDADDHENAVGEPSSGLLCAG